MTSQPSYADVPAPKPRYSLRALFCAITVLAVLLATIFQAADFIALPVLAVTLVALPFFWCSAYVANGLSATSARSRWAYWLRSR